MNVEDTASLFNVLRGLLPSADMLRRGRIRAGARKLITLATWPDDADTDGSHVAQLALLRVLHLQREARKAARAGLNEATAVSARLALEAALQGLYCLYEPNGVSRLKAANAKSAGALFKYLVDDGTVPQELIDLTVSTLGTPGRSADLFQMAEYIDKVRPDTKAVSLYRRYYVPTSTFFVHTNAASLLRHVDAHEHLTARPAFVWTRNSALRIADGSVGLLAAELARHSAAPAEQFEAYAQSHIARAFTPMAVVLARGLREYLRLRSVSMLVRSVRRTRAYVQSEEALRDTRDVRKARVRDGLESSMGGWLNHAGDVRDQVLDTFSEQVLEALDRRPPGPKSRMQPQE
ncbi:hypothetical protein [Actinacidiphila rubida]|nr:hypothetical protein [Actinacidiphila rubida]